MHGFNWFDRRGTEGVGFVRALRTLLTNNLPQILPTLGIINHARFAELHLQNKIIEGQFAPDIHRKSIRALAAYQLCIESCTKVILVTDVSLSHFRSNTISCLSNHRQAGRIIQCCILFWTRFG